jgi:hypothetical protein
MILSRILMVLALAVLAYLVYITMNGSENFKNDIQLKKAVENNTENFIIEDKQPVIENVKPFVAPLVPKQENFGCGGAQTTTQLGQQGNFVNVPPKKENMGCAGAQTAPSENYDNVPKQENMIHHVNPQPQIPQLSQLPKQENFVATPEKIVYEPVKQHVANNISYESAPKVESFNNKQNIKYEKFADVGGIADNVYGAAPFGGKSEMDEGDFAKVSYTGLVDGTPGDVIQIEGTDLLTAPLVDNMLYTNSIANTNRNASQDLRGDIPLQFNETYTPFYSSVIYGAPLSEKQMTIGKI